MVSDRKVNLFIYGSLKDPEIFDSVSGLSFTRKKGKVDEQTLYAEPAFLPGYRKVSPDNSHIRLIRALISNGISLII